MASEVEAGAADGAIAFLRRRPKHALPVGSPCPNCATALQGPWCHACGQAAEDYHRSLARLAGEAIEGLFELDGRLWRTLPDLLLRPARLTRQYLDGHRAPQAPPFRTFLIVVVLVFFTAGLGPPLNLHLQRPDGKPFTVHSDLAFSASPAGSQRLNKWMEQKANYALAHPDAFQSQLTTWAQRLSILALPISAVLLGLLFVFRRGVYMFDHLIFSMHSLSFQGLLLATVLALEQLWSGFAWLMLASPVHLFFHLKGAYGLGVIGTLVRMLLLFVGSLIGFTVILVGLLLIGLYEVGP
ncbi:DUF3667 domain-containing protein [Caulobacter sp. KR2-114]|uniref:DUF3667 domain-containing protein n=1 Tax=Caulobacter sp. KR2-114 TaxID=3400912 RepID=UPI003C02D7BD